ncbi:MAG TPA: ATP-binding cassette domain-containing protein, partial [Acetobacteraceae bacterium]|nr:ATP-binding cassette domain-containing protein [Acetobacteraceae bacterium]
MTPILEARGVGKTFTRRRGLRRELVHAVRDVSFAIGRGETLGIVGESGCGKSTLARTLVAAHPPSAGEVLVEGRPVSGPGGWSRRALARHIQLVFQDPYASLNPRLTVGSAIAEVIRVHRLRQGEAAIGARVDELLDMVGLSPAMRGRLPHAFSGGQ